MDKHNYASKSGMTPTKRNALTYDPTTAKRELNIQEFIPRVHLSFRVWF